MRCLLLALGLGLAALSGAAQTLAPVGVDLFGDGIAAPLNTGQKFAVLDIGPVSTPGYEHALLFQDGRQLRGTLAELTASEVVWSRPDMEPALRFSRSEIRRIQFTAAVPEVYQEGVRAGKAPKEREDSPVTVKLPGGDWLFGDARSENGQEFSMTLAPGAALEFSRAAVQWLYFGAQPAPAFGFFGEPLGMEGWIFGNPATPVEVVDGQFHLQGNGWVGRDISPPERFEIDFEVPDTVEPTRLWLQPFRPSPNSYSTGTIELSFGQKELTRLIFFNRFARERISMPEGKDASGLARYRVFYDLPGERLAVMRNETLVGEWKLREEPDAVARPHRELKPPRGLCFDRGHNGKPLVLSRVRLQPWDGVLPKPGAAAEPRMVSNGVSKAGAVEALAEKEITVAGEKAAREEGIFVDFAQAAPALKGADALLSFGRRGELATTGLEVQDGRARGRAAAVERLDLPVAVVEAIVFPQRKVEVAGRADVVVMRNGDSMTGELIAAAKGSALRWRTSAGQELTMQPEHIAGARIGANEPMAAVAGATFELICGDRLRGEFLALAEGELRLRHKTLGERTLPRNLLKTIYPSPKTVVLDAGADPEAWLGIAARGKPDLRAIMQKSNAYGRVYLDGTFVNPPSQGSGWNATGISRTIENPERFELRCEVTDAGGAEPYLSGSLGGVHGSPSVQFNVGHGQLRVYAYNLSGARGRVQHQEREMRLTDKLPEQRTRRELRIFVDSKAGTMDYMVDGVHLMRFGANSKERAQGVGAQVSISTYSMSGNVNVLSNVWLGPWNGDVPRPGEGEAGACLNNGDVASGVPGDLVDGKIAIGEGADAIDIPIERITSVEFGAPEAEVEKMAARVRMVDGTVMNLRDFEWSEGKFRGESPALGRIELAAKAIQELILSPAPPRFPKVGQPKKVANQNARDAAGE